MTSSVAQIRAAVNDWADGIRTKVVAKVFSHFAEKSVRYYLALLPRATLLLQESLEAWFATFDGPIGYDSTDLTVVAEGGLGYCHSCNRIRATAKNGTNSDVWFRETLCLRNYDRTWLITRAHESVPVLMDGSFRAAVDLKPNTGGEQ